MSRQTVEQRVARGIALLDERGPEGWRDRVNLDDLDMINPRRCVLGQVYDKGNGPYSSRTGWRIGKRALAIGGDGRPKTFGFIEYHNEDPATLADEWRRQLRQVSR